MSKNKPEEKSASGPEEVQYNTPFPFTGTPHEECGRVYKLSGRTNCYAFRTFADSLDGFELRHNEPGKLMAWDKKVSGEPLNVIKVFGVFAPTKEQPDQPSIPASLLYNMLQDAVFRPNWDPFRQEAFTVVQLNENNDVGYYAAKSPMPMVSNRDFVNQRMWHDTGREEYVIFNSSVPHEKVPESYQKDTHNNKYGKFIRGISKLTGYLVRPWRDPETGEVTGCCLTYMTQSDPRGWIPSSISNYVTTKYAPSTIEKIAKALEDYQTWLPEQQKKGTYNNTWKTTPQWWFDEPDKEVPNDTIDFAVNTWAEARKKKESKK